MTTIKTLREQIDYGLIMKSEVVGQTVKIGFGIYTVTGYRETPKDFLPNVWELEANGNKYEFTPHHGITRL